MIRHLFLAALAMSLAFPLLAAAPEARPSAQTADGGRYFGPLKGGKSNGKGRMVWSNGAVYEGGFVDGLISGQGVMRFANGDVYDGQFRQGLMEGLGRLE